MQRPPASLAVSAVVLCLLLCLLGCAIRSAGPALQNVRLRDASLSVVIYQSDPVQQADKPITTETARNASASVVPTP